MLKEKTNLILPRVIAHRGASLEAPENTLPALRRAHERGAQWVECDVMLTQDEVPIIFHDEYLNRTTNGQGKVSKTFYRDIAVLDGGSWFSDSFKGVRVPTLKEWLELAGELKMGVNLEMKVRGRRRAKILAQQLVWHLEKFWSPDLPAPLFSSFYRPCLQALRQLLPEAHLGYLVPAWTHNWQRLVRRYACVSFHMAHQRWTPQRIAQIKKMNLKALAYTVDHRERAEQLFDWGIDAIFSNNLDLLK